MTEQAAILERETSLLQLHNSDGYYYFDEAECRAAGREMAYDYQHADPFPHIMIDNFLDKDLLRRVASTYPPIENKTFFDRDQERFKFQFHPRETNGYIRNILAELNSQAFLGFLEEMTGIPGLIADPYFNGGGLHLTRRGGHLGVHADFNLHKPMKVERRLNLLVYLNDDWPDEYGGKLELWDKKMTRMEKAIAPLLGRAVIFSTTLDSYHGHPEPLTCPPERDRRSIATYYYTALPGGEASIPKRTTAFQARPGSQDKTDWKIRSRHFIDDWVPPRLQKYIHKLNPFR